MFGEGEVAELEVGLEEEVGDAYYAPFAGGG